MPQQKVLVLSPTYYKYNYINTTIASIYHQIILKPQSLTASKTNRLPPPQLLPQPGELGLLLGEADQQPFLGFGAGQHGAECGVFEDEAAVGGEGRGRVVGGDDHDLVGTVWPPQEALSPTYRSSRSMASAMFSNEFA